MFRVSCSPERLTWVNGAGETVEEILHQYPSLEKEDIAACLQFASSLMDRNYVIRTV
ncbi:MAG: DUF433 domain-containing protein [Pyrinomonadaceae bacterium]